MPEDDFSKLSDDEKAPATTLERMPENDFNNLHDDEKAPATTLRGYLDRLWDDPEQLPTGDLQNKLMRLPNFAFTERRGVRLHELLKSGMHTLQDKVQINVLNIPASEFDIAGKSRGDALTHLMRVAMTDLHDNAQALLIKMQREEFGNKDEKQLAMVHLLSHMESLDSAKVQMALLKMDPEEFGGTVAKQCALTHLLTTNDISDLFGEAQELLIKMPPSAFCSNIDKKSELTQFLLYKMVYLSAETQRVLMRMSPDEFGGVGIKQDALTTLLKSNMYTLRVPAQKTLLGMLPGEFGDNDKKKQDVLCELLSERIYDLDGEIQKILVKMPAREFGDRNEKQIIVKNLLTYGRTSLVILSETEDMLVGMSDSGKEDKLISLLKKYNDHNARYLTG